MQENRMLRILIYNLFLWYRKVWNTFLTTENRQKSLPKAIFLCCLFIMQMDTGFYIYKSMDFSFRRIRGSEESMFKDTNLENAVREIIQKSDGADLEDITEADLSNRGIENLEGIEHLVSLKKKLNLSNNNISDISALEIVLKRGLDDFTIVGNEALDIADFQKLDSWMRSGQKNMALADNLEKLGYHSTPVIKGDLIFTNDVYNLTARDGCVFKVSTAASGEVLWETEGEGVELVHDIRIMDIAGDKKLVLIGANGVFDIPLFSQND